ncbi:MAG: glycosyltransferase family 2 protein, partial [Psychroserpens sp.]|nr:glycosyltransferase family 2 protein [Psychroserpens sp.]
LAWASRRIDSEIIVIDDHSSDGTATRIKEGFGAELSSGLVRYFELPRNLGVTGAKNFGVGKALGEWVIFLDSDDLIISRGLDELDEYLRADKKNGVLFLRCLDNKSREPLGVEHENTTILDKKNFERRSQFGECLPVVRRSIALRYPYDVDLRGSESVAYSRMICGGVKVSVLPIVARLYEQESGDRLSASQNNFKAAENRMKAHFRILNELKFSMGSAGIIRTIARIVWWALCFGVYKIYSNKFFPSAR